MVSSRLRSTLKFALFVIPALLAAGCATWSDRATEDSDPLPTLKENSRSLIMEVEFVPIIVDEADPDDIQSLWQWVDETVMPSELRRDWQNNGLRAGKLIDEERFRARLSSVTTDSTVVDEFLAKAEVASNVEHGNKRIPMRLGRRHELPVHKPISGSQVTLVRMHEETVGRSLSDPQFLFAITCSGGDAPRQAYVRMRPEIQHGSMRQKVVSSGNALRMDTRRETWSLKELEWEFAGQEDDVFVISGTVPRLGVGGQMLSGSAADQKEQLVVMLIKLSNIPVPKSN